MSEPSKQSIQRTLPRKKKRNQLPIGLLVFALMVVIGVLLSFRASQLGIFWLFGGCFGFVLQKSRFCFTASLRDPCITGSTSITKAVLIAFAITSIGFTAIKYSAFAAGQEIPGQSYVMPVSLATVVGGIIFGIGMVIAGGCASGTLMRVGEGFAMQMLALVFFVIGSLWGAKDMGWWNLNVIADAPRVFLPDIFGWLGALVLQLLVIACLYVAADLWERKKMGTADEE
ncbi:MAG: YeeE/YedE thiosulfate transporter family protein [Candidatus Limiplasma sp.]|nr:YeeE/YedE thiosulfate transporter family protein [Candidatus Limiplasma sp.]